MIRSLQAGRALAAPAVVVYHTTAATKAFTVGMPTFTFGAGVLAEAGDRPGEILDRADHDLQRREGARREGDRRRILLDPAPKVFGYHEVFHAYVCAAATCQFVSIAVFVA